MYLGSISRTWWPGPFQAYMKVQMYVIQLNIPYEKDHFAKYFIKSEFATDDILLIIKIENV